MLEPEQIPAAARAVSKAIRNKMSAAIDRGDYAAAADLRDHADELLDVADTVDGKEKPKAPSFVTAQRKPSQRKMTVAKARTRGPRSRLPK